MSDARYKRTVGFDTSPLGPAGLPPGRHPLHAAAPAAKKSAKSAAIVALARVARAGREAFGGRVRNVTASRCRFVCARPRRKIHFHPDAARPTAAPPWAAAALAGGLGAIRAVLARRSLGRRRHGRGLRRAAPRPSASSRASSSSSDCSRTHVRRPRGADDVRARGRVARRRSSSNVVRVFGSGVGDERAVPRDGVRRRLRFLPAPSSRCRGAAGRSAGRLRARHARAPPRLRTARTPRRTRRASRWASSTATSPRRTCTCRPTAR